MLQCITSGFRHFIVFLVVVLSSGRIALAQNMPEPGNDFDYIHHYDSTAPCRLVETMPAFKGDLMAYRATNCRYPDSSLLRGEEGRVVVQFIVDTTGCVRDPKIVRSSNFSLLDQEALRVVHTMMHAPLWTAGKQNGRKKEVFFTLPITFKID